MNGISDSNNIPDDDLITIVFRYWRAIPVIVILSGLTGFLYFLNATPVYTSKAKIYFRNIERPKDAFFLYAQTESIVTHSVIERAIKDGHLDKLKTFESISHPASYIPAKLDVRVGKKDGIITISFDSENPSDAAMIVNSVVKSYINFYMTHEQQKYLSTMEVLEEEKAEKEQKLLKLQRQDYFRQNSVFVSNSSLNTQRLAKLSEYMAEAQQATIEAKNDYEMIKSVEGEPEVVRQFALVVPNSGIYKLLHDMEKESETFADKSLAKQIIKTNLTVLEELVNASGNRFASSYIKAMELRWKAAQRLEKQLQKSFEKQTKATQMLSENQSRIWELDQNCKALEISISDLKVKMKTVILDIVILEDAQPAVFPSRPDKNRIITIFLGVGLIIGCGTAVVRNYFASRH